MRIGWMSVIFRFFLSDFSSTFVFVVPIIPLFYPAVRPYCLDETDQSALSGGPHLMFFVFIFSFGFIIVCFIPCYLFLRVFVYNVYYVVIYLFLCIIFSSSCITQCSVADPVSLYLDLGNFTYRKFGHPSQVLRNALV